MLCRRRRKSRGSPNLSFAPASRRQTTLDPATAPRSRTLERRPPAGVSRRLSALLAAGVIGAGPLCCDEPIEARPGANEIDGIPPPWRNHLAPTADDTPTSADESSVETPRAIAFQNRTRSSRRAVE